MQRVCFLNVILKLVIPTEAWLGFSSSSQWVCQSQSLWSDWDGNHPSWDGRAVTVRGWMMVGDTCESLSPPSAIPLCLVLWTLRRILLAVFGLPTAREFSIRMVDFSWLPSRVLHLLPVYVLRRDISTILSCLLHATSTIHKQWFCLSYCDLDLKGGITWIEQTIDWPRCWSTLSIGRHLVSTTILFTLTPHPSCVAPTPCELPWFLKSSPLRYLFVPVHELAIREYGISLLFKKGLFPYSLCQLRMSISELFMLSLSLSLSTVRVEWKGTGIKE